MSRLMAAFRRKSRADWWITAGFAVVSLAVGVLVAVVPR